MYEERIKWVHTQLYPAWLYGIVQSRYGPSQHVSNFRHVLRRSIRASLMEMPYSIYHLTANSALARLLWKSVALCYRKYGDSNLIIYTHRTSWMISSYSTTPHPAILPAATILLLCRAPFISPFLHPPASSYSSYI